MHIRLFATFWLLYTSSAIADPGDSLSLSDALARALKKSPDLQSYDWEVRAAEARSLQAGLKPNPELNYSVENLPGSGPYQDGDLMENTFVLSQLVELGGKRNARVAEAAAGVAVVASDYQVNRIEVLKTTAQAFVEVLAAQEVVELARENAALAESIPAMTQKRVDAGKASAVEAIRSKLAVATAKIELEEATRNLLTAKIQLAAQWGAETPDFSRASGNLNGTPPIADLPELIARVRSNPEIERWAAVRSKREAALRKQHALAKSDVTVFAGPRAVGTADDITFNLGFSIPLPFKNKNQGGIAEAEAEVAKTESEAKAAEVKIIAQLSTVYQTLQGAKQEANLLRNELLPAAADAEKQLAKGYEEGRFPQLEILDARRTLIEARKQYLRAITRYHQAHSEIEAMTAGYVRLPRAEPVIEPIPDPAE